MDIWLSNYFITVLELNRMLGMHFIWDGQNYKSVGLRTPIGESIMMVPIYHNQGDYTNRNVEISKLCMLAKDLQIIEKHDQKSLSVFKKKMINTSKNWGTYFGVRMEIKIAAFLIKKGVNHIKTESPDFTVPEYGVFIECGSSHKSNKSSASLIDKIHTTIAQKSKKKYCNSSTVLCMDITNIASTQEEIENELLAKKDSFKGVIEKILKDTNSSYGSVLLFSYYMDTKGNFTSNYWRVDNFKIMSALLDFLNKYFPTGEFRTGSGWTPRAG